MMPPISMRRVLDNNCTTPTNNHPSFDNSTEIKKGNLVLIQKSTKSPSITTSGNIFPISNSQYSMLVDNVSSPTSQSNESIAKRQPVIVSVNRQSSKHFAIVTSTGRYRYASSPSCINLKMYDVHSSIASNIITLKHKHLEGVSLIFESTSPEKASEWTKALSEPRKTINVHSFERNNSNLSGEFSPNRRHKKQHPLHSPLSNSLERIHEENVYSMDISSDNLDLPPSEIDAISYTSPISSPKTNRLQVKTPSITANSFSSSSPSSGHSYSSSTHSSVFSTLQNSSFHSVQSNLVPSGSIWKPQLPVLSETKELEDEEMTLNSSTVFDLMVCRLD